MRAFTMACVLFASAALAHANEPLTLSISLTTSFAPTDVPIEGSG